MDLDGTQQMRNKRMKKSTDMAGTGRMVPVLLLPIAPQVRTQYMVPSGKGVVIHASGEMKGS